MSIKRWSAKADTNTVEVMKTLRKAGALVSKVNEPAFPDLVVGFRGKWYLMEVKRPLGPKGGDAGVSLNPKQAAFFQDCQALGLPIAVVRSPEEALDVLYGRQQ